MLKSTKLLAAAAALCLAIPGTVLADGPRVLKIGFILAQQSQLGAGTAAFAAEIEKSSGGKFKIEQYPGAVLGDEVAMIKGLQLGTIDLAFITGAPLPSVVKEMGVLSIPFIFRDAQHAHAVLDGPIGTDLVAKFAPKGLVALAWGENGMRQITSAKRAIAAPEDLKGLKLRVPQNEVTVAGFKALGADAAPLGFSDLYGALQTGKFDAQENPIATIVGDEVLPGAEASHRQQSSIRPGACSSPRPICGRISRRPIAPCSSRRRRSAARPRASLPPKRRPAASRRSRRKA